jgi:class 3 adenylate cyclase
MQRRGRSGQQVKGRRASRRKTRKAPVATADLQKQVAALTREVKEAREQQTATSEVLQVISSSSGELAPVFESLLASAKHLCGAEFGIILLREGDAFRTVALHSATAAYAEARWRAPFIRPAADTGLGRVLETKQVVQIADVRAVAGYVDNPLQAPIVQLAGVRSKLSVPMLKEKDLIGVIEIDRQEVRPFTDKQIELVKNFAAQAVIAIENARLLNELRQRTDDLSEALEQQTATADILAVISSSQAKLKPVFEIIVDQTTRICGASFACLGLFEGSALRFAAISGASADVRFFEPERLHQPDGCPYVVPLARAKRTVQTQDLRTEKGYLERDPFYVTTADVGGARTALRVPLLRDGMLLGHLWAFREEVRPFSDKQVALVQNFAAQAVIAVENARLLSELRQREHDLTEKSAALAALSSKLAKYLAPQVYDSIFTGRQDVRIVSKRKKLTVCFSDLVGFTEITDQMESEDLTQLLNHYLTEMSKIALQYGATIDKYVGDAIVMFFGDPTTRGVKQDALACVQMAVAMQQRVGELAEEWRSNGIETLLRCRIGIHTGYCTVGNFGSEDRMDYTMVGGTVNLASRLEHEAPPGGMLISFETYAHVKDEVHCEERGQVRVKGIAQPVATYAVLGPKQDTDRSAAAHLRLEFDAERMTNEERKATADTLRRALGLLEKVAKPDD